MDNPSNILGRLSMEKINNDVVWGREERGEPDPRSYDERLNEAEQRVIDCIASVALQPGPDTKEAAVQEVRVLLETAKDVYTTIGIKVGSELAEQKLCHERQRKAHKPPDLHGEDDEAPSIEAEPEDGTVFAHYYPTGDDVQVHHSKDFFSQMESRVNLQSLGAYIRDGGTPKTLFEKPFEERLNEANEELKKQVTDLAGNKKTAEKIQSAITQYETVIIDVYFSVGIKVGSQLSTVLMGRFDKDY